MEASTAPALLLLQALVPSWAPKVLELAPWLVLLQAERFNV